ncbi:MAG: cellulase family glycosylhydrolase, partial [bacterium]
YILLDMHDFLIYWAGQSEQKCVDSSPEHQQMLGRTWRLLATKFQNDRAVLGYDIMNQPVRQEEGQPCGSCNWKEIAQSLADSIRTIDENHLILVEGPNFSLASNWQIEYGDSLLITDRVNPPRIVYSPHVFFDFNNNSQYDQTIAGQSEDIGPIGKWQFYLRDRLLPIIDWSYDNNVPIFIGETNVPCTKDWADVLEYAFVNFFDPIRLSVTAWHYVNPAYCPLTECPLNLIACAEMCQLFVFKRHLGGVYEEIGNFTVIPSDSRIYNDERVNPWNTGEGFFDDSMNPGIEIDFCANDPVFEGNSSIAVHFNQNNFAGVKFIHQSGLDTRRFKSLRFWIYLAGNAQQNFKIFTTYPLSDCETGQDIVYPPHEMQPELRDFVSPADSVWQLAEIPLNSIVNDSMPIINGIAFQNMGMSEEVFYLDDIHIIGDSAVTSVSEIVNETPDSFILFQNYPNPFNESTTIRYSIRKASHVTINVYNILGEKVETLIDKDQIAGEHSIKWDASIVSSGLYFYRIAIGKNSKSKRLIVLK